ncbi:MAG: hypothetical protein ABI416_01045 [Ginsengibacter sp.]
MLRFIIPLAFLIFFCNYLHVSSCNKGIHSGNVPDSAMQEKSILFSGFEWKVRNTRDTQGPGPNYFSQQSVWVDQSGVLHLYLHPDSLSGRWLCPEITSVKKFGFGTYSFVVEGAIDKFDRNIVLGLFNYSGNDGFDELDIEFSRWGNDSWPNLNYTVWPAQKGFKNSSYTKEYSQQSNYSNQQFRWSRDSVVFSTFNGNTIDSRDLIATYTCVQPPASISSVGMPVHLNLWLFDGHPPVDNKPVEVLVHSFSFTR